MEGQQTKLDAISNNLANVGTNGFKRGHVVFEDLIYQNLRQAGAAADDTPMRARRGSCPRRAWLAWGWSSQGWSSGWCGMVG